MYERTVLEITYLHLIHLFLNGNSIHLDDLCNQVTRIKNKVYEITPETPKLIKVFNISIVLDSPEPNSKTHY